MEHGRGLAWHSLPILLLFLAPDEAAAVAKQRGEQPDKLRGRTGRVVQAAAGTRLRTVRLPCAWAGVEYGSYF